MAEGGRRRDEFVDVDGLGRKADYGLKRRMAAVRFVTFAGLAGVVALVVGLWLFGQFLSLATLPAILILASAIVAAFLYAGKRAWMSAIAFTLLAFAVGLAPHAIFLIVYNLAVAFSGQKDPAYLPALGGLFDSYEDAVIWLHIKMALWSAGSGLILLSVGGLALVVGLFFASRAAVKLSLRPRLAVGLAEAVALGAVSTALFTLVPAGHWSPNYAERLGSDLLLLDQTRARVFLTEKAVAAARAEAPNIHQAYEPTLHSMAEALGAHLLADPSAAARALGADYAETVAEAGSDESGINDLDPGPAAEVAAVFPDRPGVLSAESSIRTEQHKLDAARQELTRVVSDAIGQANSPTEAAMVDAFASGLAEDASDRLGTRFDTTFGQGLPDRLSRLDDAPGHPLSSVISKFLVATLPAEDAKQYEAANLASTLTQLNSPGS